MKTSRFYYFNLLAILLLFGTGCHIDDDGDISFGCERGNGNVVSSDLNLGDFHSLRVDCEADVYLTQGSERSVRVEIDQNLLNEVDTDIRNGEWEIDFDECVRNVTRFDVFITMPDIKSLTISGSGRVVSENVIEENFLDLNIRGSGSMDIAYEGADLNTDISGSGDFLLEGVAENFGVRISGSGDVRAFNLDTEVTDINISGSGDAEVRVEESLRVRISGSGNVFYKGDPSLDINITGSGDVVNSN